MAKKKVTFKKKDNLWNHLYDTHGLTLLETELQDILWYARKEIELPDAEEIKNYCKQFKPKSQQINLRIGITWALDKVRNPYPKQINP